MSEQVGVRSFVNRIKNNIPSWGESLPEVPQLIHDVLQHARNGTLQVQSSPEELQRLRVEMRQANRRSFAAIVGAALIVSAAVLLGLDGYAPVMLWGAPVVSWGLGLSGVLLWLVAWPRD